MALQVPTSLYTVYSMTDILTSTRGNLSSELADTLRQMIVDGRLAAGERINEVHLSQRLGVSRTPLREALTSLAQEGALTSLPRIGWFVRPLTLDEFEQIYPIRALLDPEALRLAGIPTPERLARLGALNARIADERDADSVIALDDEWHLLLIDACPNRVLIDLIRQFIRRTHRYEIALMREGRNVAVAKATHDDILAALGRGDLDAACKTLRRNLQTGFEPIAAWLRARETGRESE